MDNVNSTRPLSAAAIAFRAAGYMYCSSATEWRTSSAITW